MSPQSAEPGTQVAERITPLHHIVDTVKEIFNRSEHQLTVLTRSQQAFDWVSSHFSNLPKMNLYVVTDDEHISENSEALYRRLKGPVIVAQQYWEEELQRELQALNVTIKHLGHLSSAYRQYDADGHTDRKEDLTFVVSNPRSPLMAVYSGNKAMVYNFSGD